MGCSLHFSKQTDQAFSTEAPASVLVPASISPRHGPLLVHVPEDREVVLAGRRDADLGMFEIRTTKRTGVK